MTNTQNIPKNSFPLSQLPGIPQEITDKCAASNLTHTHTLLQHCTTPKAIETLANQLQIPTPQLKKWVVMANLAQLESVGCEYCGLLLHAGIISPSQLAQTSFPRLHQQIIRFQVATTRRRDLAPSLQTVQQWVKEARSLVQQS
ncbi:DUF4332 domain-containing protein [Spirulina sp. CS-785/01]|uniref:DUF4332 domain-containing protein n=1 Tax=Spirulina sp. CS-785/01 TaxID=3021716 RepID=UPI0023314939|nr:DUF4332 domain-containing protein [Spirulina sp. CS-785/01]MDB9315940.1 DUF4332 domain-containing protein [Spirulina sp. CS-785/01]